VSCCDVLTRDLLITLKTFFVIYILMFSVEFLSALVMCFLWASFLDLYCENGVCTVESVVCLLCVLPYLTEEKTLCKYF
jgi:hypothetical protein